MNISSEQSIQQKLNQTIDLLMDSSLQLRQAITARKTEEIWDILANQEEQAINFNQFFQLWQEMSQPELLTDTERHERQTIRQKLIRLKAIQQANAALTHSYLSAVRKAIDSVSNRENRKKTNTYNAMGRMGRRNKSMLIQSVG